MKKNILLLIFILIFCGMILPEKNNTDLDGINRVLDAFHKAASIADESGYLGCLDDDAIFLGTDGNEKWTKNEFASFVKPYFSKGIGWTYIPKNRSVHLSQGGKFAWFSEKLFNDKYGELRGSGVLRKNKNRWKIVQYNMVFVIPNRCSKKVVKLIRNRECDKKGDK